MMPWWGVGLLVFGGNFLIWGVIGVFRLFAGRRAERRRVRPVPPPLFTVRDVAVLIPAHNEEVVIADSLSAIAELVDKNNIHVVSDFSTDQTAEIAEQLGVHVMRTPVNLGKAGALEAAIEHFELVERFPLLMILDADTRVQPGYFRAALPMFEHEEVVAVAGCVRTETQRHLSPIGTLLVSHRARIYAIGQRLLKFGQTGQRINATHIVPGFASVYRTSVLPGIEMNPPGLVIEDFNMTFEVYQRNLGKVGFTLNAVAVTQDPDNLRDYIRQTRRWALGLWQTVRRHPPRLNLFTAMLTLLLLELITSSVLFLLLVPMLLILGVPDLFPVVATWPVIAPVHSVVAAHVNLTVMVFGVAVPDYAMTCVAAALERRPRLLLYGFFFLPLRVIDAALGLYAVPMAWLTRSNGRWRSPTRRRVDTVDDRDGDDAATQPMTPVDEPRPWPRVGIDTPNETFDPHATVMMQLGRIDSDHESHAFARGPQRRRREG